MSPADPPDAIDEAASSLTVLADPTRRSLYRFVAQQQDWVSREQAAEGLEIPAHTAKFHLDRLVDEGLLDVDFRRLTGRTGPGAGRPAKLYRRSEREISLSLPQRRYDLLSEILAQTAEVAVAGGDPMFEVASRVSQREGHALGAACAGQAPEVESLRRLAVTLHPHGFEPRIDGDRMVLENCPFDRVARDHTALVCGINLDFVRGMASGLGCTDLQVSLEPSPGRCCVSARRVPASG